jgi:ribosome-associated toxin RatA of RatAB toxin-antitoxin module
MQIYRLLIFFFPLTCLIGGIWLGSSELSMAQTIPQASLSESDRASLNSGMPLFSGEEGKYTTKILVNATIDRVWEVLTDYSGFPKFLPTVTAIKMLESNGNQKVYEQTNTVQVLFFSQNSKVAIAVTEIYPSSISFQLRESDTIASLKGTWKIESISPSQVLIANQVNVEPSASVPRDFFFNIYSENLIKTLSALKQEMEKR